MVGFGAVEFVAHLKTFPTIRSVRWRESRFKYDASRVYSIEGFFVSKSVALEGGFRAEEPQFKKYDTIVI
jgi:hypothetical protein